MKTDEKEDNGKKDQRGAKQLSERQQQLLSSYYDNECGVLARFKAKRLASKNPSARDFITQLDTLHSTCLEQSSQPIPTTRDMWSAVSARIEQETRAAQYLGKRAPAPQREGIWERLSKASALAGGLSGAALAALALVVWYKPVEILSFSAPQAALVTSPNLVQPVGIGNLQTQPRRHYRVTATSSLNRNPLEVDWMRSSGSLKLIPDPTGSSAIIWIRRREVTTPSPAQSTAPIKNLNTPGKNSTR
jgi:hypothetical protein